MATRQNTNNDVVSIRELYQLVDQRMGEVNSSILRLGTKVDSLEGGRVSVLEQKVAGLEVNVKTVPMFISIAFNILFFIMNFVLNKK
jgi:hypothetical protein